MNRNMLFVTGAVAVLIAGLLTLIAYRSSAGKIAQLRAQNTGVVVAAKDLLLGQKLETSDLTIVQMPAASLPQGVFHNPNEVIGRSVISLIAKNEVVLASRLTGDKSGSGLPALIPANMRAVSVKVNEVVSVAGFVGPGARVDVLVTGSPGLNFQETVTTTVLKNVEVLAAGQKLQPNAEGKPENVTVITLLVSPQDAEKLTLASSEGKIQLSLRNPADANTPPAVPLRKDALYGSSAPVEPHRARTAKKERVAAPAPVASPTPVAAPLQIEIYRGPKVEVTKF